jgi:DNA polymerase-3 subunit delta
MAFEFENILLDVTKGRLSPVYFFQGDEPYFIDVLMTEIEQKSLLPTEREFNQNIVYGKDVSLAVVLEMSRRYPMMAQRQTVLVKEAQDMADLGKKEAQLLLSKYLQNPVPSTVLAFAYKGKKIDGKTTLAKDLKAKAVLFESKKLYDNQLPDWLKNHIRSKGLLIEEQAVFLLVDLVGNDLNRMANEVEKILIGHSTQKPITLEMVRQKVAQTREFGVFDLQNAIAKRDVFKTNQIADYFVSNPKENPLVVVISSLFGYFSKIIQIHSCKTLSQAELAQKLKVHPFFVKDYLQAAKNFPLSKALDALSALHEADLASKGIASVEEDDLILKKMLYKILH